ncbi:2-succinyl-5-enolpyruvyl-6-hydroxy-3-cyclohexene-1-carboxylic-acid synthase [uncultured Muribaculum sp.]|uniref:2-succinyl-5-enolpyruvyl-6-hydroxy-3- cyclohexene-1-carboxylic-acid synthase n=1 Tax=uncultured Muribaculum sp. TaxID=1918613 RepID=UPI0025FA8196|nr:2-succinyl-5-enolpyruvyl-6-hydroxy-3-cyclohexene-1-carboxylic-acid synthase [uncultured Muribaculum sp.]
MKEDVVVNTDKESCRILVSLLEKHGVVEAVVSPGSRNAPVMLALNASGVIRTTVVIDERSAAFIAMGKASVTDCPVALVCTSGTALLNYAPAVAEAYYRKIPLIVVSADRPMEWIDQDDSQTLRQYEALANYVKGSYNIPADCSSPTIQWYVNRMVNDAMISAMSGRRAPVHINIQLDAPLGGTVSQGNDRWVSRTIATISPDAVLSKADARELADVVARTSRVLVIAGFHAPDSRLREALRRLSASGNVAVMTETISNVLSPGFINDIDSVLSTINCEELDCLCPEVVITLGGAIVSRFIKQYLRRVSPREHWHVGLSGITIDCFQSLTRRIEMDATPFFEDLVKELMEAGTSGCRSAYHDEWMAKAQEAQDIHNRYLASAPWSDLRAVHTLMNAIPEGVALQLSNGTSVRYAQLFPALQCSRSDSNRGVSGIDGSTSTAVGAASAFPERMTLLLTGDMSAQYDIGALAAPCIPSTFRMAVLCNGGGGIFRFIDATRSMPILDRFLVAERPFPLRELAAAYGFEYMEASSEDELTGVLPAFFSHSSRPVIMAIHTPGDVSATVLRGYLGLQ